MGKARREKRLKRALAERRPSEPSFANYKNICVCCEQRDKRMNKEHFYPQWLLKRTKTRKDLFDSPYGKIPADQITLPLCEECNSQLGIELEVPVSRIFDEIEAGNGFNDFEAELLIRWMWKTNGLFYWAICNDHWKYGYISLKEHVLTRILKARDRFSIAISLIRDAEEDFGCSPVGMDAFSFYSNVYAVGVFSSICIVVFYSAFSNYFDSNIWTVYKLSSSPYVINPAKKIFPKIGFPTSRMAITYIRRNFGNNSFIYLEHEKCAIDAMDIMKQFTKKRIKTNVSMNRMP